MGQIKYAKLLKPVRFVSCLIIMVIPLMLCFPSFLTISYHFPCCLRIVPLVFLRFSRVFQLFPHSVSLVSYFAILLQNATKVRYKMRQVFYYKIQHFYYKMRQLLQNTTVIRKCVGATFNQISIPKCDKSH